MKTVLKVVLPLLVLLFAVAVMFKMFGLKEKPESKPIETIATPVSFMVAHAGPVSLGVETQGTVSPRLQTTLAAEVGGKVTEVSAQFEAGRFVQQGDLLLRLDPTDYEAAVAESLANLRSAQTSLVQAEADAEQAISDLKEVGVDNPSPLARREPQLEQARLRVDSAQAALALAEKNLERTQVRAPFDGQIVEATVDRGDVLANRGTPIGTLYGTESAEIALPLSRTNLLHLSLPDSPQEIALDASQKPAIQIKLGAGAAGIERTGWVDRLSGTADPVTRLQTAIALFNDPLSLEDAGESSIPFGSFVSVRVEGRTLDNAFRLPIVALVGENRIRIIDESDQLQEVEVTVAQITPYDFVVTGGLPDGVRVCLTPLETFAPNMPVRPNPASPPETSSAPAQASLPTVEQ